jgi:hypothetical protein
MNEYWQTSKVNLKKYNPEGEYYQQNQERERGMSNDNLGTEHKLYYLEKKMSLVSVNQSLCSFYFLIDVNILAIETKQCMS